jgi:fatty-acyl-CoA synthase
MVATAGNGPALRQAHVLADDSVELVDLAIGELLTRRAMAHGDRTALVGVRHDGSEARLTYAQLHEEAARVAAALSAVAGRGSLVALWSPNVLEWPVIQYGAALAGVVLVALNPALRADELEYALRHSGARVLIHADTNRDDDLAEVVAILAPELPDLVCISLSERCRWQAADVDPTVLAVAPTDPDDTVMLQYTSGTTGRPKGVVLTHRSLVNVAKLTMEAAGVECGSVFLNPLPMFHTAGCVIATLGPLWLGGTVVLLERFQPAPVLEAIHREKVSVLMYVPTVLGALLECQRSSGTPAPRLSVIMGGASLVPAAMIEAAEDVFGASVLNAFGQTELAPVLSITRPTDARSDRLTTVGRPLPRVECKIVDPASGETMAISQPGEICARGYQQFVEYLHDPEATARAVDGDGFLHTGDLGMLDERGYLLVTGRLKDLIIRGGENIAPAEIETVLVDHEAVLDAAVVGVPDDRWGEIVAAVIRVDDELPRLVKDDLVDYVAQRLAPFKVPVRWFVADALPVTPTGKVRKFALRDAIESGELLEI